MSKKALGYLANKYLFLLFVCGALALVSLNPIQEGDVFWQIRGGEEIALKHTIQTTDTWSSTESGKPWFNFQWLFCLILYGFSKLTAGYYWLPTLKSLLVFLVFATAAKLLEYEGPPSFSQRLSLLVLLPLFFAVGWAPIELRAELLGVGLFAGILLVLRSRQLRSSPKILICCLLLLLWTNLHGGTAPIGIFLVASAILFGVIEIPKIWLRLASVACVVLVWFLSPIGVHIIEVILQYFKYDASIIHNNDQMPLTWQHFSFNRRTISNWLLFSYLFATIGLYLGCFKRLRARLSAPYQNLPFVVFVSLMLFGLMTAKYRNNRYLVLFLLPIASELLKKGFEKLRSILPLWAIVGLTAMFSVSLISYRFSENQTKWGLGISEVDYPIETVNFIKQHKPAGKIFNNYNFGGYLVQELHDYPDSSDSRELIFEDFFRDLKSSTQQGPAAFGRFLRRHQFDLLLAQVTANRPDVLNRLLRLLPFEEWALIYVDKGALLFARRAPEHQALISDFEYKELFRKKDALSEVERCLSISPGNPNCRGSP